MSTLTVKSSLAEESYSASQAYTKFTKFFFGGAKNIDKYISFFYKVLVHYAHGLNIGNCSVASWVGPTEEYLLLMLLSTLTNCCKRRLAAHYT
jgi:hypothetical protein